MSTSIHNCLWREKKDQEIRFSKDNFAAEKAQSFLIALEEGRLQKTINDLKKNTAFFQI